MHNTLVYRLNRTTITLAAFFAIIVFCVLNFLRAKAYPVPNEAYVTGAIVVIAIVAVIVIWLANQTELLRDSYPTDFGLAVSDSGAPLRRPYSLALSQMAWWFFLVFAAYVYLELIGQPAKVSDQALTLMGIGTGTALGAVAVQQTKTDPKLQQFQALIQQANVARTTLPFGVSDTLQAQLNKLGQQLASTNFFTDILTDVNGVALHRFQALAWTIVLGCIFVAGVVQTNIMPPFDGNLMALLGISSGAYLGFKISEQPD